MDIWVIPIFLSLIKLLRTLLCMSFIQNMHFINLGHTLRSGIVFNRYLDGVSLINIDRYSFEMIILSGYS